MSVTQQQVLEALAGVRSPRGVALTNADVLSPIAVSDGKVFFSINVDAAEARAWETVRAQAESVVRALPGVASAQATYDLNDRLNPDHEATNENPFYDDAGNTLRGEGQSGAVLYRYDAENRLVLKSQRSGRGISSAARPTADGR